MTSRTACFGLTGMLLAANAAPALAWGNEDHRIVCEIALQRLSPAELDSQG